MVRDRLILHELEVTCRLGVYEWEQASSQAIWIDVELPVDAARAAVHDDLRRSTDYAKLVTAIRECAERRPYRLTETLAETVATLIVREFKAAWVRVRVKKRALAGLSYAAVEVERRAPARVRGGDGRARRRARRAVAARASRR